MSSQLFNPYTLKWGEVIDIPSTRSVKEFGNRIYNRYPARSVFLVPRAILNSRPKGQNVLDPFMGSGTTAVEAVISGNKAFGTEMDPFARKVASVSVEVFTREELLDLEATFQNIKANWASFAPDEIPDLTGIERWFNDGDLLSLLKLKACIFSVTEEKYLSFMLVVLADSIKPVSKMERQSTKPYISSKFPKKTKSVEESFCYSFRVHIDAINEMSTYTNYEKNSGIVWLGNDATNFSCEPNSIDIAITSPPYINAFDYTQCIKVESSLCGLLTNKEVSKLKKKQVGQSSRRFQQAENNVIEIFKPYYDKLVAIDKLSADTCLGFFSDIYKNLCCVYGALKNNGEYHIIIGDSNIKKTPIPSHDIIAKIAESIGYEWFGYYQYSIKDHRTSIPRDQDTSKIKTEHVIMLRK